MGMTITEKILARHCGRKAVAPGEFINVDVDVALANELSAQLSPKEAFETLKREAEEEDKSVLHHLAHLTVHGYLHLLGYDHQTDSEAGAMEAIEREILASLGIADPYAAREPRSA